MKHTSIATLISLALSAPVIAEETYRSHDAHVHGHVEVNIAQDGNELLLEVTAPGADVVGFEYAPKNAQEEAAVKSATALLNQPEAMFQFPEAAQCKLIFKSVTNSLSKEDSHAGHDHHDEHKHDHDEHEHHDEHKHDHDEHEHHDEHKHDHDKHEHHDEEHKHDHDEHEHHDEHKHDHDKHEHHDEHKHDHDKHEHHDEHKHDHDSSGHGEFTVEYHYQCGSIEELNNIDTQWFTKFSNTEAITLNLLTDKVQTQQELTAAKPSFRF